MKRLTLLILLVFTGLVVHADESEIVAVSSLKVDLDAVTKLGVVSAVDGVTTAGQPDEEGFKVFAEMGYAAVIDLRTAGENRGLDEPSVVEGLGMALHFPDVCKTPSPSGPTPIPYPNTARSKDLAGGSRKVMVRDLQIDPIRREPKHVDFLEVDESKPVVCRVPFKTFEGQEHCPIEPGIL